MAILSVKLCLISVRVKVTGINMPGRQSPDMVTVKLSLSLEAELLLLIKGKLAIESLNVI